LLHKDFRQTHPAIVAIIPLGDGWYSYHEVTEFW
jgi:hypothetical protein